jgi:hypothetical protein
MGFGRKRRSRVWYVLEHVRECTRVRRGSETYRRVVRAERWCVRLDRVGGKAGRDDVWYRVARSTYDTALGAEEHARLRFVPMGSGC